MIGAAVHNDLLVKTSRLSFARALPAGKGKVSARVTWLPGDIPSQCSSTIHLHRRLSEAVVAATLWISAFPVGTFSQKCVSVAMKQRLAPKTDHRAAASRRS